MENTQSLQRFRSFKSIFNPFLLTILCYIFEGVSKNCKFSALAELSEAEQTCCTLEGPWYCYWSLALVLEGPWYCAERGNKIFRRSEHAAYIWAIAIGNMPITEQLLHIIDIFLGEVTPAKSNRLRMFWSAF